MGKALVIKDVDFGANALTTVTFGDNVPCTALALDNYTLSLQGLGTTGTLTATPTPANTTDSVTWSTSDPDIATVAAGVITIKGAGEVTITATCGQQTASCVVTATVPLSFSNILSAALYMRDRTASSTPMNKIVYVSSEDANYGYAYSTNERPKRIYSQTVKYPIFFGKAEQIAITAPNNIKVTVIFIDSTKSPYDVSEYGAEAYTEPYALWISGDASPYDSTVPLGNRTINVPEGADSAVFSFRKTTADLSQNDINNISIVAV